jgi:hypothetical protein
VLFRPSWAFGPDTYFFWQKTNEERKKQNNNLDLARFEESLILLFTKIRENNQKLREK